MRAWVKWVGCLAASGGCALVAHAAAPAAATDPVVGRWGGGQVQLVIDASGGRIQTACGSGTLAGPLRLSSQGRFQAAGTFEQHQPGAQRADEPVAPAAAAAQYSGEVKDGLMRLLMMPDGGLAVQQFQLRKGHGSKLICCL